EGVLKLVREQHTALESADVETFNFLRGSLMTPTIKLDRDLNAFVAYADQRGSELMGTYHRQMAVFGYIGIGVIALTAVILVLIYL
ncbi:hypothetical protein RCL63_22895, partial [Salmonella enterica subsp. enterica serovar Stanley]